LYLNMQATLPWPTRWLLLTRQVAMNGGAGWLWRCRSCRWRWPGVCATRHGPCVWMP
jgi:hypothetical protein